MIKLLRGSFCKYVDNNTAGPAMVLATIPATKYIPVPTDEPTPSEIRS